MGSFDPTRAPSGRLTRLGVVLDGSLPVARLIALARMSERAGIEVIWIAEPTEGTRAPTTDDAFEASRQVGAGLERACLGIIVGSGRRTIDELAAAVFALATAIDRPLEVDVQGEGDRTVELVVGLTGRLSLVDGETRPRISASSRRGEDIPGLLAVVDDIVLPGWERPDLEASADEVRAAAVDIGRDPVSLGVAALVPVSIGRTGAEASARADVDVAFSRLGHPAEIGIFGTLEECQDRVIALAHAGVSDLRCVLPGAPDVHDVIAQLTAMTVGTTDVLRPGALRSPAPAPPDGWGGRSPLPTRPIVSDGSRRR